MAIRFISMFLPVLLVGLAVLAILITALRKAGPVGRGIILLVILLPGLLMVGLFYQRSQWRPVPEYVESPLVSAMEGSAQSTDSMAGNLFWQDGLEEEFAAEPYSSIRCAAYGLGRQLHETIEDALGQSPSEILILEKSSLSKSDLNEFRNGLKSQYEGVNIYFGQRPAGELPAGMICVAVNSSEETKHEITLSFSKSDLTQMVPAGTGGKLEAAVETGKGKYYKGVSFDYRPWLWDYDAFCSQAARASWLVFVSDETATDRDQARDQALAKAVEKLSNQVQAGSGGRGWSPAASLLTKEDLRQRGFVTDEFSQKLQGMAGPIWRYAILLNASPERMQSLISAKTQVIRHQRYTWARSILSLGGMILLVCVVYVFANAATKGYYSTVLAVTAIAAAVLLGLVIVSFA